MSFRFDAVSAARMVGAVGTASVDVDSLGTAIAFGSGDLPVFATPRLVALMEEAACDALSGEIPQDATSVGSHVEVQHLAPSPVGAHVVARAAIAEVSGARVVFDITATHEYRGVVVDIGRGTHTRVVVDRDAFLSGLSA